MSRWTLMAVFFLAIPLVGQAQVGSAVNGGLNGDSGSMNGPNINVVNGINANGTPRQQSPGSSMTNGAGNSTMTPRVTGGGGPGVAYPPAIGTTKGTVTPTGGAAP